MDGMNIGDWFSVGASLAAMGTVFGMLLQASRRRRDEEVKRGAREEADRQAHARIDTLDQRVSALENDSHVVELTLVEIKTILQRVVVDVAAMSAKLDGMRQ